MRDAADMSGVDMHEHNVAGSGLAAGLTPARRPSAGVVRFSFSRVLMPGGQTWRAQPGCMGRRFLLMLALMMTIPAAQAFDTEALEKQLQQAGEVNGSFTQQRFLKALPRPLVSSGQFGLLPGKSLLWHVQKPFEQKVRIDEHGMQHWRDGRWQADSRAGGAARAQLDFFMDMIGGRFDSLRKHFTMKLSGNEAAWKLHLDPSSALMKRIFSRIDIAGDTHVRSVHLDEVQGDRVEMRFEPARP